MTDQSISRHPSVNVTVEDIEQLVAWGFYELLPTWPGSKFPEASSKDPEEACLGAGWKAWVDKDPLAAPMSGFWDGKRGVCYATGYTWILLDLDNREAEQLWRSRIPQVVWDAYPISRSHKGYHLHVPVAPDEQWYTFDQSVDAEAQRLGALYDVKARGGIAMLPPSLHPDRGFDKQVVRYRWVKEPHGGPYPEPHESLRREAYQGKTKGRGGQVHQMATQLLKQPPPTDTGRNTWLTSLAGHLAKWVPFEDAFEQLVVTIDRSLDDPMGSGRALKVAESIWQTEHSRELSDEPTQHTGWLSSGYDHLLCLCRAGDKDNQTVSAKPCSDFDLRVLGKYANVESGATYYRLQVESQLQDTRYLVEPAATFGDSRKLSIRLRALELNVWPKAGDVGAVQAKSPAGRLGHYLSTQPAPRLQVAPFMGWHDEARGFVCDEGVITADGLDPLGGWMPDPIIIQRNRLVHRYGFEGTQQDAQAVLKEIATFQDEVVCSVFGAWWAACLVKAQLMPKIAGFPFMAVEATSGTGKSEGYFSLMIRANGATRLGSHLTPAMVRDSLASNRSGIVWIDDMDDASKLYQDIRTATNESYRSKKSADNTSSEDIRMVAPVFLSGESLPGLSEQTALADRLVRLDVPPAKDRRSKHGDYPQWDDILDLQSRYPEMWRIAGWYVRMALQYWPQVENQWKSLRGQGRHGDKLGVLRLGARLFDMMTGDGWHAEIVDDWCSKQEAPKGDFLVNRILPELLRDSNMISSAIGWQPVFVDDTGTVWWHPGKVRDAWTSKYRNSSDARVRAFAEIDALTTHRRGMGVEYDDRGFFDIQHHGEGRKRKPYYPVPNHLSEHVLRIAEG